MSGTHSYTEITQETNDTIEKKTENNPKSTVGITVCDWDANTCKKETLKSISTPTIRSNDSNKIQKIKSSVTWYTDTQEKHQDMKTDKLAKYGNTGCRFCAGGTKLERFLPKNQHTQKKIVES